LRRIWIFFAA